MSLKAFRSEEICDAIRSKKLRIGVFGLGWMGISTACLFLQTGAVVVGADVDANVVELLNSGKSPINEPGVKPIIAKYAGSTFKATTDVRSASEQSDILIIIVPTSIDSDKKPDYTALEKVSREIGMKLRKGSLVIIESTVGPGVTESIVKPILEKYSGLTAGDGFLLAYSPIRGMAGKALEDIRKYPRIVGGLDPNSLRAASAVMGTIVEGGIVSVSDIRTAEAAKLFENVYRDVNIALANELACLCEKLGIDFAEARQAALTQPYCHLHLPGIGVGGHCIPFNPYFLIDAGSAVGVKLRLVAEGRKRNDGMPRHTVSLIESALRECGSTLGRSSITILGISYRANVKDARYSPSVEVIRILQKKGARVRVYDPYFSTRELKAMGYVSAESLEHVVNGANCLLIAVAHSDFQKLEVKELSRIMRKPGCIVDAARVLNPKEVMANRLVYYGVGYGHRSLY